jgi:hypothetical protein
MSNRSALSILRYKLTCMNGGARVYQQQQTCMYATLALVHSHTRQRKRMMCTKAWPFDFHQHERILSRHHASDHTASVSICTFAPDRGARCSSSHSLTILSMGTKVPNADHVVSAPTCVHVRCCYQTIYLQCTCVAPLAYQSCTVQCCCKCTVGSATEYVSLFCVTISVAPQPCLRLLCRCAYQR